MKKYLFLASATLLLAGCATSPQDCDLHAQDPSFLTKLSCTTSGSYRQQIDAQERQIQQSTKENNLAKQDVVDTQLQVQESSQKLADEKARLTAAKSDLAQTLKKAQSGKSNLQQRQQEIKNLQALQKQAQQTSNSAEVAELEKKVAAAKEKVELLEQANTDL